MTELTSTEPPKQPEFKSRFLTSLSSKIKGLFRWRRKGKSIGNASIDSTLPTLSPSSDLEQHQQQEQKQSNTEDSGRRDRSSTMRSRRKKSLKRPTIVISPDNPTTDNNLIPKINTLELHSLEEAFEDDRLYRAKSLCRSPGLSLSSLNSPASGFQPSIISIEECESIDDMPPAILPTGDVAAFLELQRISMTRSPSPLSFNNNHHSLGRRQSTRGPNVDRSDESSPRLLPPTLLLHQYQTQLFSAPSPATSSLHRSNSTTSNSKVLVEFSHPSIIRKGSLLDRSRSPSSSLHTMSGNGSGLERTLSKKKKSQTFATISANAIGEGNMSSGDDRASRSLSRKSTLRKSASDESHNHNSLSRKKVTISDSVNIVHGVVDDALALHDSSSDRLLKRAKSTSSSSKRQEQDPIELALKDKRSRRKSKKEPLGKKGHHQESDDDSDDIEDRIPLAFVRRDVVDFKQ